jgi:CBS domain containing-hemolysin-like protein
MIIYAYIPLILLLMCFSFLFSGSETGFYRLSRFRLRLGVEQKRKPFEHLFSMTRDGQNMILVLLLGNNLVNYGMTTLFTILLYQQMESQHMAELYSSLILTPLVFVFCEMIPKSVFYHKADVIMPRLSGFLRFFYSLFSKTGILQIFKLLFALIIRLLRLNINTVQAVDRTQRQQVYQIIHETQEEGLLSDVQKDMIHRLINIPDMSVGSVMVPLSEFGLSPANASRKELTEALRKSRFLRHLVYEGRPDHIIGFISLPEVLAQPQPVALRDYAEPLPTIDRSASVIEAINLLRRHRGKLALVTEASRTVGVITMTDLIEELTGEMQI